MMLLGQHLVTVHSSLEPNTASTPSKNVHILYAHMQTHPHTLPKEGGSQTSGNDCQVFCSSLSNPAP